MMKNQAAIWRKIIVFDHNLEEIAMYPLDRNAKLLVKMKRQQRRNLGKVTGKRGIPRNKKSAIKKLLKLFPELDSSNENNMNDVIPVNQHSKAYSLENDDSGTETKVSNEENHQSSDLIPPLYNNIEYLTSIHWLLNNPPEVSSK